MAVSYAMAVAMAAEGSDPETLNPTDPSAGDILMTIVAQSNTGGFPDSTLESDSLGGTWTQVTTQSWGSRRRLEAWINDDWTTASGTVDVNFSNDESGSRGMLNVSGADDLTEDHEGSFSAVTQLTATTMTGSKGGYTIVVQKESQGAWGTPPTGWVLTDDYDEASGIRRVGVFTHIGTPADLSPTFGWTGSADGVWWAGHSVATAGDVTVTLTVAVAAVASVPTITVNAGAVPAAATVAAVASVPGVTPNAGSTVALSASVDAVASVPGVTPNAGATVVLSSAVAAVASVPEVAVTTGSTATVTLSVAVVATAGVGTHTPNAGAAVSAVSVDATAGVGTLAITAGAIVSASTVAAVAAVGVVVVTTGVLATDTIILATYKQHTFTQTYEQPTFTGTHRQHTYTRTYEEGR